MSNLDLKKLAFPCLHCLKPRCEAFCPCKNPIRDCLSLLKEGKEEEAAKLLYSNNPLPELTSLLCDHARQCTGHCIRGFKGEPVPFPSCEHELALRFGRPYVKGAPNGKKVVFVGMGPSNISCAFFLLEAGFEVTFYEKEAGIGGAIYKGIPAFRFDHAPLKKIEDDLVKLDAKIYYNVEIGVDIPLKQLEEEFDYVILGVGAEKENMAKLPEAAGIVSGLAFLRDMNLDYESSKDKYLSKFSAPIVWGGGNVAMDCCRTAMRLFGNCTLIYRRSEVEMPAAKIEIEEAKEEGIDFLVLQNITEPILDNGVLKGVKCIKMELGEKDESGRASFHEIPGSEFSLDCDLLLPCLGEKPDMVSLDPNFVNLWDIENPRDNIYLNGDCKYGAKNIASAVTSGRELAKTIIGK